jgi:rubrerythrin
MMPGVKKTEKKSPVKVKKYFRCEHCGYVTIVKDSFCPICAKEGVKIKVV